MTPPLVVLAEFEATADTIAPFLKACQHDATRSKADEPGCLEFAIQRGGEEEPHLVVLYEVYRDRAAFQAHEAAPHFSVFATALKELGIRTRRIRFLTLQPEAGL